MNETLTKDTLTAETLTWQEMHQRFRDEWVLIADPEVDESLFVTRGLVVWHSKDRDEVYNKDIELRLKVSAALYTGNPPDDAEFVILQGGR